MTKGNVNGGEVDVVIIGAGPAGLMAALWMSRYGIKTHVIDKRHENTRAGQADGIQCRSLEIFDSFDLVDQIWKESCHMAEMSMWSPGNDGIIRRSSRISNTIPGISRFPCGVLLAQHRIEAVFLRYLEGSPKIEFQRGVAPSSIEYDRDRTEHCSHPVTIKLGRAVSESKTLEVNRNGHQNGRNYCGTMQGDEGILRAKYVIGCDGAHSWVRTQLGFQMEGEQTEFIWGVLDIIPLTNFPDIRTRCAIHSAESGTIMMVPREDRLVRIYCQLSTIKLGTDGRFDRSQITPETILKAAQQILKPYRIDYKYCDWWTVYQIGQRVGDHFSADERIFLAGDAIHTHSPKAGQGMNISMQDAHNLGWKLALVIKGIARPSILKTYEAERRAVAKELITFDQQWSKLFSSRPSKGATDLDGVSMSEFETAFRKQKLFSSGLGICYDPSILTASDANAMNGAHGEGEWEIQNDTWVSLTVSQQLATKTGLGKRFPSFKVVNHCDAQSWHFAQWLKADGLFHIVLFAGDVSQPPQMERVRQFAKELASSSHILSSQHQDGFGIHSNGGTDAESHSYVADILTIHSAPRQEVEFHDFPSLLRPFDKDLGYDYNRIFVDGESYYEGHGHAYDGYGVDKIRGCVTVVRPDQHVAWIGELEDVDGLKSYFAGFLVGRP